jgi:long-chain fatty acid transport protein
MKKKILSLMAFAAACDAFAGGLLTNTNQNAAFVRNFAQEGKIDLTSIYTNPAGGAFLSNGWHLSLNTQTAFQERNIETTFPLFVYNTQNPNPTHRFEGKATAPLVPSFTVSYNKDKWSLSAHFAISGGGGKCEFDDGLGSFEAAYSAVLYQMAPNFLPAGVIYQGYSLNSYMKGRSYHFGLQVGGTYKFLDNVAGYVGIRGLYASANYNGFVNPTIYTNAGAMPLNNYGIDLNCDQTGLGATIILGVDWKINKHWNVAAKYECPTRLNLKNKSQINIASDVVRTQASSVLGQFEDGQKVREDVPALLALGAQYSPIEKVRLCASYHQFFDKVSTKYMDRQDLINHNTHEFILGAEYDICKLITISGSWEITRYGLTDAFMNDLSFNLSNNMVGGGVRINASKKINIDLGYMCTFYNDRRITTMTAAGAKSDLYSRKNHTFAIGLNFDF